MAVVTGYGDGRNSGLPPDNLLLAVQLCELLTAGRLQQPAVARSLLRRNGDDWTPRQCRKAIAMLGSAQRRAGETVSVPPFPYTRGGDWWRDVRPERQAARGRKSGRARRWETRHRDARICRWFRAGKYKATEIARHVGLSVRQVYRIVARVIPPQPPKVPWKTRSEREVVTSTLDYTKDASLDDSREGREPQVFGGLLRWTSQMAVRKMPDEAIFREAERLNARLDRPLTPGIWRSSAKNVNRIRWRS